MSAQFLWTGVDYLGEAASWPSRAAPFGLLDLCGFKKPLGWFRQSLWSDKPIVYLCVPIPAISHHSDALESWNWTAGSTVKVACYTNCGEVELTLNGRSLGVKPQSAALDGVLTWEVPYEPGALKAIARTNGRELSTFTLQTAGAPDRIALVSDAATLRADGENIAHLELVIVDANGIRVRMRRRRSRSNLPAPPSSSASATPMIPTPTVPATRRTPLSAVARSPSSAPPISPARSRSKPPPLDSSPRS